MDAATRSDAPATKREPVKTAALGRRRWNTEMSTTPIATPHPRAKMNRPKPSGPARRIRSENTGPRGTSMPPPMSPVASPTFTARTTGLMKTNCQPSFSSWNACPKSSRDPSARFGRSGPGGRAGRS